MPTNSPEIKRSPIEEELRAAALDRILVIEGAMDTTLIQYTKAGVLYQVKQGLT